MKQALDLLQQWVTMDTEDALELLGPTYPNPKVRSYAVSRLRQAPDEVTHAALVRLDLQRSCARLGSSSLPITTGSSSPL